MNKLISLYKKYEEIINYLVVGFLTTLVSLIIYYGLAFTYLNPNKAIELQIANVISWIGSVLFAFITNRKFVFKSKNKKVLNELSTFVGSRVLTLLIDIVLMFILVTSLKFNDKISKLISQVFVIIFNYIFSKVFVFKK